MKKLLPLLFLGLFAAILPSCCGFGKCCNPGKTVRVGCENQKYTTEEVTKYKTVKRTVYPSAKGGVPYQVDEKVAYTETVEVKQDCGTCGSIYCPAPGCCGTVSPAVIKRATGQGGTGEPHIGTIPTMKVLAE